MKDSLSIKNYETPVGRMQIIASASGLCAIEFIKPDREKLLRTRLQRWFSYDQLDQKKSDYIEGAISWLDSYFKGDWKNLPKIKLDLRGTPFEKRIWAELQKIPLGETISYSDLARRAGIAKAPRAAGSASRRNPISILIPCHRVIGKNGDLTGYGGGLAQKKFLIEHECSV